MAKAKMLKKKPIVGYSTIRLTVKSEEELQAFLRKIHDFRAEQEKKEDGTARRKALKYFTLHKPKSMIERKSAPIGLRFPWRSPVPNAAWARKFSHLVRAAADFLSMTRLRSKAAPLPACKGRPMKLKSKMFSEGASSVLCAMFSSTVTLESKKNMRQSRVRWMPIWTDRFGIGEIITVPRHGGPVDSWLSRVGERLGRDGKLDPTAI